MIFKFKKGPHDGSIRTRRSYCIFPIRFNNKIYWLEPVIIDEEWSLIQPTIHERYYGWDIIEVKKWQN